LPSYVLEHVSEPWQHLLLAAPFRGSEATAAVSGETLSMRWHSERGVHVLAGSVYSSVEDEVFAWRVDVNDVVLTNRRRHVRVPVEGQVDIVLCGKCETIELVDISESGVRCRWCDDNGSPSDKACVEREESIHEASAITVIIQIGADEVLTLCGSVAWVREADHGVEFSVAFIGLDENDKETKSLRMHVLTLQREQLRRNRSH
jgi:hypothetical protein